MTPPPGTSDAVAIELTAVLVALTADQPLVLTLEDGTLLPSGPFATEHPTLQSGVRAWVERQTHHPLGYVEQLYTFADRNRLGLDGRQRVVSISYLGLTRERLSAGARDPEWRSWYRYFPWEDWRAGPSPLIARSILPQLLNWAGAPGDATGRHERQQRVEVSFGDGVGNWNEDLILQRYELLYEAGLVPEAKQVAVDPVPGMPMRHDHRRILATGIARLRAKIKYRPVFFELMPPEFTLLQLQRAVEALAGRPMHKQNFRRLIDAQGLVEPTGASTSEARGRPAKLFRFRREVVLERAVLGSKLPLSRQI